MHETLTDVWMLIATLARATCGMFASPSQDAPAHFFQRFVPEARSVPGCCVRSEGTGCRKRTRTVPFLRISCPALPCLALPRSSRNSQQSDLALVLTDTLTDTYRFINRLVMYKTVRKGDASLQYTILPQTDQYSSSGFPQSTADKTRLRLVKFAMASLVILVVLTCVATPFLLNDSDKGLLVGTVFAMSRHVGLTAVPRNSSERKTDESAATATTVTPSTHGYRIESIGTTARISASTGSTASSIASSIATSIASSTAGSTASSIASFTEESSTIVLVESSKARENDTMPQVYEMKAAGIGSHGLSLEGLIFKSPEGTIKPWPQKWFFGDSASKFQWKGLGQIPTKGFTVLTGLAILATVGLVLFYVQRRATRPHRQNDVEEPAAAEGQEEDESTLLGPEGQESEEKE